jgi:signal transduction histidine kinase/ActR/RegA family two-component response regulator
MWNTLREGKVWKGGMTHEKKDGKLQELDMTLWPIRDATGSIVNYVSVSRDMTNEVRLAEQLRQKQKMEAIGTLAGGIAHDFNNILAAIIGNAELGLDDPGTSLGTNHNLEQILKAGKRGRDLVKQILMFSRKETKERQTVKLTPIIDDTIKLIRASLPTMINIVFEPRASLDTALANPSQMQQVLMNLASNAAHAMRENGGVLEISVYNQELSKRSLPDAIMNPGQYVVMAVRDTGPGIDQTVRKRIFEPFFTTKEPGQGTGMGLAVAYGIVNSHQGTITVSSQTGKGSTFKVFLPAVSVSKVSVDEVATQQAAPKGNERILFVDDEEALAELSGTILSRLGYEVTTKTNPIEALSFFAQNPDRLDLVIVDQTMPDMTGMSLAREMMRIRPDIPMILSTGYSDLVSPETARAAGIAEFLMKPVERNVLADTVRTVLDGKSGK